MRGGKDHVLWQTWLGTERKTVMDLHTAVVVPIKKVGGGEGGRESSGKCMLASKSPRKHAEKRMAINLLPVEHSQWQW